MRRILRILIPAVCGGLITIGIVLLLAQWTGTWNVQIETRWGSWGAPFQQHDRIVAQSAITDLWQDVKRIDQKNQSTRWSDCSRVDACSSESLESAQVEYTQAYASVFAIPRSESNKQLLDLLGEYLEVRIRQYILHGQATEASEEASFLRTQLITMLNEANDKGDINTTTTDSWIMWRAASDTSKPYLYAAPIDDLTKQIDARETEASQVSLEAYNQLVAANHLLNTLTDEMLAHGIETGTAVDKTK
jgi:hypothetical protein